MNRYVALLRGINVGGHKKVAMAELRTVAEKLGLTNVSSYIQSGNLLFSASAKAALLEAQLEQAIAAHFGFAVDTLCRSRDEWAQLLRHNPFPAESEAAPNQVQLHLSKRPLHPAAAESLRERAQGGERIESAGGALWIYYPQGLASTKLSPALLDRLAGSPVTGRNVRTLQALSTLLDAGVAT